ncbi:MAG: hypothetical protein EOP42_26700, partial [Sphingobacteriaceae bacterium]
MSKKLLLLSYFSLFFQLLLAQNAPDVKHLDSVKNATLIRQSEKLETLGSSRQSDSLKKMILLQLQNLTPADSLKVYPLVKSLQALKQADSARNKYHEKLIDSLKKAAHGFPVMPFDKMLFYVYSPAGGFSPQE